MCQSHEHRYEVSIPRGQTVSAWAGLGEDSVLLALDDQLRRIDVPTLQPRGGASLDDNVHRIAVHPDGRWVALATGCQGNFQTHGNLLHLDLETWKTRPLLEFDREVVDCEFLDDGRVRFVLGWSDELDARHHEGVVVPRDVPAPLGSVELRLLTAAEQAALEQRGEPA